MKRGQFAAALSLLIISVLFFLIPLQGQNVPFSRDTDHDGFPDDLETATGNNPRINEPLEKSTAGGRCGIIKTDPIRINHPRNVLIILDTSGSMRETMGESTRIEIAKKVLTRYIDALPPSMRVGFVIYGKSGCGEKSVELIAPIGSNTRNTIKSRIQDLQPMGQTPIAFTLRRSLDFFHGIEDQNNSLILISDGRESCGGNPVQVIRELKESPVNPDVTVIGLNVSAGTRRELSGIAEASDGVYRDVHNEEDFMETCTGFFKNMTKMYKDIVCIVRQYNAYLTYETIQYNRSRSYLVKAEMNAENEDMKRALVNVRLSIDKNHAQRTALQKNVDTMISNKLEEMREAIRKFTGSSQGD